MSELSKSTAKFWADSIDDLINHGLNNKEIADYIGDCMPETYVGIIRYLLETESPQS